MEISEKTLVKLNYKGTLDDGSVFDTSEGREPLEFVFGLGMIIPGLEEGIKSLKVGDKKSVKVNADKAYGPKKKEAMQEVPKEQLPKEAELKVGMQLAAQGPQGTIPVTIAEIKDKTIVVDFNHPLAGKDLTFDVEILDVRESTEEDMKKFMTPPQEHNQPKEESSCGCSSSDEKKDDKDCCKDKNKSTDKKEDCCSK